MPPMPTPKITPTRFLSTLSRSMPLSFTAWMAETKRQLGVAVHLAGFLAVDVVIDVETFHLAGELCLELGSIKQCNGRCPAHSADQALPGLLGSVADRCHRSEARYNNSF